MATRTISRNDLVGLTSLSFIRPQTISFSVTGTKPSTRLYAFFDGVSVDAYITPSGGSYGGNIVTDAAGSVSGTFAIPPATFNTGERVFRLQDSSVFDDAAIAGSVIGTATATFRANGLRQTYQETITNIEERVITIENIVTEGRPTVVTQFPQVVESIADGRGNDGPADPLAQTFFTYGIKGGCYITKIAVYFQSKDSALPITLQVRNVVNGYPGSELVSKWASVTLSPVMVTTSSNATSATEFAFSRPIYLEEDRDYCFVLMANSNAYNVWTSKFGETSTETGKTIFEQPYVGSLFKSENNKTWTAEQTEDIKFTIYKANFTTGQKSLTFKANSNQTLITGESLSVTSGSAVVTANLDFQHSLITGDKIVLTGIDGDTYRGISNATISSSSGFTVNKIDDYSFTFNVGTNATSTGTLAVSGKLNTVFVDNPGSGYTDATVAATISAPPVGGTQATATVTIIGGSVAYVTVTNKGSGYTSVPTISFISGAGAGAILTGASEALFSSTINRKFQAVVPIVNTSQPPGTNIYNTLKTSSTDYTPGTATRTPINVLSNVGKEAVILNTQTETLRFGSNRSTEMVLRLETDNPNVSPMVDLGEIPRLRLQNYLINSYASVTNETTPSSGTAQARYVSKIVSLETPSTAFRVFVTAASTNNTSFDVFVRTSLASSAANHKTGSWVKLTCDSGTSLSRNIDDFKDYEFYVDGLSNFDVYDIKIVLYSSSKYVYPKIANYRTIVLAT